MDPENGKALFSWLLSEGPDAAAESIEIHLGMHKLTPDEWYISNGKIIIETHRTNEQ